MYIDRINYVKEYLRKNDIDAYIVFISDDHGSEYISDRYKSVRYLSGFTGSAGTLLITKENSYLWTDGRYFLQASSQLKVSKTILKKIGEDESIVEYIKENVNSLVFDFKVANVSFVDALLSNKPSLRLIDNDLVNAIWSDRKKMSTSKVFALKENAYKYNAFSKCHKTINNIKRKGNYGVLISALDDIAFLCNLRGKDIKYNPVFMSFMFLSKIDGKETYTLYINKAKLDENIQELLKENNIEVKPYLSVYKDVKNFNDIIYYNKSKTNFKLYTLMKKKKNVNLWPTLNKAIKTNIDIKDSINAHILDGVAMFKFIYYVKHNVGKRKLSELSLSNYLAKLRRKQGAYDLSFNTICGYKDHGAIIHYSADENSNYEVYNDGFLLVDSGGQYLYGTTDITRTIVLANVTEIMKKHFTLVLKSHIDLAMAIFDKNETDASLDKIARKPLWDEGLDYNHGTGHGVGHILNVHEGPQSIRHNKLNPIKMKKGMITSNEPGLYIEGQYGIRHENELLCVKVDDNHLGFKAITFVPFDIDGIDVSLLDENERSYLNNYHKQVYELISPYLNNKERKYLKEITREI